MNEGRRDVCACACVAAYYTMNNSSPHTQMVVVVITHTRHDTTRPIPVRERGEERREGEKRGEERRAPCYTSRMTGTPLTENLTKASTSSPGWLVGETTGQQGREGDG